MSLAIHNQNEFGQPVGFSMASWTSPPAPPRRTLTGQHVLVEPLVAARHAGPIFAANAADTGAMWTYLPYGPFASIDEYTAWMVSVEAGDDPLFYALVDRQSGEPGGIASYLRIDRGNGAIEVGHIAYAPRFRRTPAATEAIYLLIQQAFELGYRRCEWKCDALNAPSRAAAERFGFSYEGLFRQAVIYKERNRDTAWYAITDEDWPALAALFQQWLAPANFDAQGQQRTRLATRTQSLRHSAGV